MSGKRVLDASLIEAYEQTHYQVNSNHGAFTLKIGIFSPELNAADNRAAHVQLVADLTDAGLHFITGIGEDPSDALELGVKYRQNAIVYADCSAIPVLLYPTFDEAH